MFENMFGKDRVETIKLNIPANHANKNPNGKHGEICNNCGGYGFTMKLKGGSLPCRACYETGVKSETREELEAKILKLEKEFEQLKQVNLSTLKQIGLIRGENNE